MNLLKKNKNADKSKTHFEVRNSAYMHKAIKKLKASGGITILFPIAAWSGNAVEIVVHCDDVNILAKG